MNSKILIVLSLLCLTLAQNYPNCTGKVNHHALISTDKPKLVASVANGKRYLITDSTNPLIHVHVAVLSGTAYEMGYAMGTLFKDEVHQFITRAIDFIYGTDFSWVNVLPKWLKNIPGYTNKMKMDFGFAFERIATAHYIPQRFLDELRGIADASGADYNKLLKVNS